jgi:hypothetical protein
LGIAATMCGLVVPQSMKTLSPFSICSAAKLPTHLLFFRLMLFSLFKLYCDALFEPGLTR